VNSHNAAVLLTLYLQRSSLLLLAACFICYLCVRVSSFLPVTRDSSDAVMLSAESAAGKYPLESVTMQQLVINKVESDEVFRKSLDRFAAEYEAHRLSARNTITSAITLAARQVRCF
jgi:hypothetical protein